MPQLSVVVVHEQAGVLLDHGIRHAVRDRDDLGVVAVVPRPREAGRESIGTYARDPPALAKVRVVLAHELAFPELAEVILVLRVRRLPRIACTNKILLEEHL